MSQDTPIFIIPAAADGRIELVNPATSERASVATAAGQPVNVYYRKADTPEPPPAGEYPEWWPSEIDLNIDASHSDAVREAAVRLHGVGGFLTLTSYEAIDAFADLMETGGGLRGKEDCRVVIQVSGGIRFHRSMKNVKGEWSDLCFYEIRFEPTGHKDEICIAPHGGHRNIQFRDCSISNWKQVIEGQKDGQGNTPSNFEFVGGAWRRIYNSRSPVVTNANQNDKNHRSQGAWWRGDGWRFEGVDMLGIGWDIDGDPTRSKCDKYSQALYGSQNATNTIVRNCLIDGVANNAIVYKGTGLTVEGNTFDRCVNFISLGTNENPQAPCKGVIAENTFHNLIPLGPKDDANLDKSERVEIDSGVAISFNNTDGVIVRANVVTGRSTGKRSVFAYFNNGKSSSVSAKGTIIYGNDIDPLSLAEVRSFRVPDSGFDVTADNNVTPDEEVLVRNTEPTNAGTVLANFKINGKTAVAQ